MEGHPKQNLNYYVQAMVWFQKDQKKVSIHYVGSFICVCIHIVYKYFIFFLSYLSKLPIFIIYNFHVRLFK
jgi:hypothetical protein